MEHRIFGGNVKYTLRSIQIISIRCRKLLNFVNCLVEKQINFKFHGIFNPCPNSFMRIAQSSAFYSILLDLYTYSIQVAVNVTDR